MENIGKFQWKIAINNSGKKQWKISHRDTQNKQQKTANRAAARPTRQWLTAFMYSHTNNQIAALNKRFLQGIRAIRHIILAVLYQFCHRKNTIQCFFYIYRKNTKYSYNSIYRNILSFLNCAKTLYIYNILFFCLLREYSDCIFFLYIYIQKYRISQNAHKGFQRPFWGRLIFTQQIIPKSKKRRQNKRLLYQKKSNITVTILLLYFLYIYGNLYTTKRKRGNTR